jgi:ABC-2 type transport system permease protein
MAQYLALSRRSILRTFRQPASIAPSLLFPLIFMAMTAGALNRAIDLPGFPTVDSFLQFGVAAAIVQGILFGAVAAGADMARDIEGGFFERLLASPVARISILAGRVSGAAVLGFFQAWLFMLVVIALGVTIEGGIVAMVLIAVVAAVLAAGIGSIAVTIGLRTGSSEAVQGSFPLLFVSLFLSSAFFPRDLMQGWFKGVADVNPLSHLIEGVRYLIITGLDVGEWLVALGIAAAIFVVGLTAATRALKGRVESAHA